MEIVHSRHPTYCIYVQYVWRPYTVDTQHTVYTYVWGDHTQYQLCIPHVYMDIPRSPLKVSALIAVQPSSLLVGSLLLKIPCSLNCCAVSSRMLEQYHLSVYSSPSQHINSCRLSMDRACATSAQPANWFSQGKKLNVTLYNSLHSNPCDRGKPYTRLTVMAAVDPVISFLLYIRSRYSTYYAIQAPVTGSYSSLH